MTRVPSLLGVGFPRGAVGLPSSGAFQLLSLKSLSIYLFIYLLSYLFIYLFNFIFFYFILTYTILFYLLI